MTAADPQVIYAAYDRQGKPLYIGVTCNLEQRLVAHAATQWFWPEVADVRVLATEPDQVLGRATEARLIASLKPRWNRIGRSSRADWTADDYMDVLLDWLIAARYSQQPTRRLGPRQRRLVTEANSRFGLNLSTDEARLLPQVTRGEDVVAFGRPVQALEAREAEAPSKPAAHAAGGIFSGAVMRVIREALGMSLRDVAGKTDMDLTAIHRIETEARTPNAIQAQAIATSLGVPLSAISFATRVVIVTAIPETDAA